MKLYDELNEKILGEAKWVFERMASAESETDRAYYQGRIDSLAFVRRVMARENIVMKVGA